jgi:hypothetical protein
MEERERERDRVTEHKENRLNSGYRGKKNLI